jgi:hypothetical protein
MMGLVSMLSRGRLALGPSNSLGIGERFWSLGPVWVGEAIVERSSSDFEASYAISKKGEVQCEGEWIQ